MKTLDSEPLNRISCSYLRIKAAPVKLTAAGLSNILAAKQDPTAKPLMMLGGGNFIREQGNFRLAWSVLASPDGLFYFTPCRYSSSDAKSAMRLLRYFAQAASLRPAP